MYKYSRVKTNIRAKITQVEDYLSNVPQLIAAYLFGSYAKKQEDTVSDVDIALLLDEDLSPAQVHRFEFLIWKNLTKILHTDEIDLFVMNKIPLSMQFEIILSSQILCNNNNNKRTDYEVLTCSKYWDFKKLEEKYNIYSLKRLKEKYLKENINGT